MTIAPGRIITFYSFKGGTGRSMAAANLAWVLASAGKRVLVIDWDLEAPGIHRYFHPFLRDPDFLETEGLIDFILRFAAAAVGRPDAEAHPAWFQAYADLVDYACSVDHPFPKGACLELVSAGRQDGQYGARVNNFDWDRFYTTFGGGVFLEAVKAKLRGEYDYVVIDSRTGVSDTAGVCSVQMPDDLVVCFTLNRQSIVGSAAIARSALAQRSRGDSAVSLRVWPVATRIEDSEKLKRERMLAFATRVYDGATPHLREPARYWGAAAVRYQPFYAFDEVLAVFGDLPHQSGSMLGSTEFLVSQLTDGDVQRLVITPEERAAGLKKYESLAIDLGGGLGDAADDRSTGPAPEPEMRGYVITANDDLRDEAGLRFLEDLRMEIQVNVGTRDVWLFTGRDVSLGEPLVEALHRAAMRAAVHVVLVSPGLVRSKFAQSELRLDRPKLVVNWVPTPAEDRAALDLDTAAWVPTPEVGLRSASRLKRFEDEYREAVAAAAETFIRLVRSDPGAPIGLPAAIGELCDSYENLRATMPSGPDRTRRMNGVVEQLRRFAAVGRPHLEQLAASDRAAEHLAAIVLLQEAPERDRISWLVDRLSASRNTKFIRYQAAVALRTAVAAGVNHAMGQAVLDASVSSSRQNVDDELQQIMGQLASDIRTLFARRARVEDLAASLDPHLGARAFMAWDRTIHDLTGTELAQLESMVISRARPALLVENDTFPDPSPPWGQLSEKSTKQRLGALLASVGRVEPSSPATSSYLSTGFMVGKRLMMTTDYHFRGLSETDVEGLRVAFAREQRREGSTIPVRRMRAHVPSLRLVLLELEDDGPPALRCVSARPTAITGREIAVVGYPTLDRGYPFDLQTRLLAGVHEVKRLMPGRVTGVDVQSQAELVHDASTQSGCGGAPVIDLATGNVLGLHYAGAYLAGQRAVPTWLMSADAQLRDCGIHFDDDHRFGSRSSSASKVKKTSTKKRASAPQPRGSRARSTQPVATSVAGRIVRCPFPPRARNHVVQVPRNTDPGRPILCSLGHEVHIESLAGLRNDKESSG